MATARNTPAAAAANAMASSTAKANEPAVDIQATPPVPPAGEIVTEQALYLTQIALYRNSLAFGGQKNPSTIWNSMVRDDSACILYYREIEEKDEDVANALDTLKLSVLERDRQLVPGDDSGPASDVRDFIQDQLDSLPNFHAVLDAMLDAPGYGFSVQEMIFDVSGGQVSVADIRDCPQELFLFGTRYQPQIGQLQFLPSPWAMTGTPVPEAKFLTFSYRGRARNRMGRPLLRSIFWPSWFKRNILRLWLQYAEKGPGTAVVRYMDGDNESDKLKAAALARAIKEESAVAVPQSFNYDQELMKIARSLNPDVYEHMYQMLQYSIIRRVLGETLTSFGQEGGGGSRAQGEVHADTLQKRAIELCRAVESVVNRNLIRPLVLWNFGPDAVIPIWAFDTAEEEDLASRVTIDRTLQLMGKTFSAKYVNERYDVPVTEGEADTLVPPSNLSNTLRTPAGQPDSPHGPNFGEIDPEMAKDHAQFDQLFNQLREESLGLLKTRTKEIARDAKSQARP